MTGTELFCTASSWRGFAQRPDDTLGALAIFESAWYAVDQWYGHAGGSKLDGAVRETSYPVFGVLAAITDVAATALLAREGFATPR